MQPLFYKIHESLPLFAIPYKTGFIVYTPGYFTVLTELSKQNVFDFFNHPECCKNADTKQVIESLIKTAQNNLNKWSLLHKQNFNPECLTIHTGSECNLNCSYCYSKNQKNVPSGFPSLEMVKNCLEYMLNELPKSCKTLHIVYHGSGEPTYHWHKFVETNNLINRFAMQNELSTFKYIATNGIISKEKAHWLAKHIDVIGISCDGPAPIQQLQRKSGYNGNIWLKQTCKTIADAGGQFEIRTTITQETIDKQKQIAVYLINELKAQKIRFEPFYLAPNGFKQTQANTYYLHFKEAQSYAEEHHIELSYSGVRIDELHTTFCDRFRNNLRLAPNGIISNCFYNFSDTLKLGGLSEKKVQLDLKSSYIELPQECQECINIMHCSRGCPDFCFFDDSSKLNEFKCELHKQITVNQIIELAEHAL